MKTPKTFFNILRNLHEAQSSLVGEKAEVIKVEILHRMSRLYLELACFEFDIDRKCKLLKRSKDTLESIMLLTTPSSSSSRNMEIIFDLAKAYQKIRDCKIFRLMRNSNVHSGDSEVQRIKSLALRCISNYKLYINIVKQQNGGKLPDGAPDNSLLRLLLAHHGIVDSVAVLVQFWVHTEEDLALEKDCLSYVINYFDKYPELKTSLRDKYEDCISMEELIAFELTRKRDRTLMCVVNISLRRMQ